MKKLAILAVVVLAGALFASSAQASCVESTIPANCKNSGKCLSPQNPSSSGKQKGCVQANGTNWVAGNVNGVDGCLCVNGIATTKVGTAVTPDATAAACTKAASDACNKPDFQGN